MAICLNKQVEQSSSFRVHSRLISSNPTRIAGKNVTQPPPPQVKKSNPWKIATVLLLVALIAMGTIFGLLWTGQNKQSQQSEYTRVKILSDGLQKVNMSGEELILTYNWMGDSAWNGSEYIQNPIEVEVVGSNIDRILPPIQGRTYNIAGFEIVVSEVYNDYVILLVKSL